MRDRRFTRGAATPAMAVWLLASAAVFTLGVVYRRSGTDGGLVAYDFYGQFYPWIIHARRLLAAGHGVLWNPYQECGQPLFANLVSAFLNPTNLPFWLLPREPAALLCIIANLSLAGVGTFGLARTIGLGTPAGLAAAFAFQLGWAATNLVTWSPTHGGALAWMPIALWQLERTIRTPSIRHGIALAASLAFELLAGFPQIAVFTGDLIVFRITWALLFDRVRPDAQLLGSLAIGLLGPPLLAAVQLAPALELVGRSLWGGTLTGDQLGARFSAHAFLAQLRSHVAIGTHPLILVAILGGLPFVRRARALDAAFFAAVAGISFVLSLGPGSGLWEIYARLPMGAAFRGSARLLWVTSFALSLLAGIAVDGILARGVNGRRLTALVPLLFLANGLVAGAPPLFGQRRGPVYARHADVFDLVRHRMTPQDRVLLIGTYPDLSLMPKSGTVFGIPNVHDYDPFVTRRYAEFFTRMRTGQPLASIDDWYWLFGKLLPPGFVPAMLDLTAARFLIVDHTLDHTAEIFHPPLPLLYEGDDVRVYENPRRLPRARWVGNAAVEPDGGRTLARLADGSLDLRRTVLLERALAPTAVVDPSLEGSVEFRVDDPAYVVLDVRAPAAGYLVLADELVPGWSAHVDGVPREIARANHVFRAVAVPAGASTVEFRYRPASLYIGATVTGMSVLVAMLLWRRARPRSA